MKAKLAVSIALLALVTTSSAIAASDKPALTSASSGEKPTLSVYVYDSFVAKGGLGPEIFPSFEKKCGLRIEGDVLW